MDPAKRKDLLIIAICWLAAVLLVNPSGNFPLNDDWAYGKAVKSFLETGCLRMPDWVSTTLAAQLLWGSLFCIPVGFSFTALRLSTLFLGLGGLIVCYYLFLEFTDRRIAMLCTLLIAVNPLFFHLSFTFMTDVPFFSLQCTVLLFMVRFLKAEKFSDLLLAIVCSIAALLTRHIGILFSLAFLLAYICKNGISPRKLWIGLLPLLAGSATLLAYYAWLSHAQEIPGHLGAINNKFFQAFTGGASSFFATGRNLVFALLYTGLFILPLIAFRKANSGLRQFLIPAAAGLLVGGKLLISETLMPLAGNTFRAYGVGPPTLRDTDILRLPNVPGLPVSFWILVTSLSIIGFAFLVFSLLRVFPKKSIKDGAWVFIIASFSIYITVICISGFYDRYLLPLVPLGIILTQTCMERTQPKRLWIAYAILCGFAYFSIAATHDYLAWNQARWQELRFLTETKHVSSREIDGGFEFNGFYNYSSTYVPSPGKSWWWVENDCYIVSFGNIPGYTPVSKTVYINWMPYSQRSIRTLKKAD